MICLHNYFSLSSHEVRKEQSIRNWKLKINISFKINSLTWLKVVNSFFFFVFYINFLWFVDCFVALLLAMTKKCCHCETSQKSWQSCYSWLVIARLRRSRGNLVILGSSLRDFAEVVAIHKKLKIKNWKLIFHLKLFFNLTNSN